MKSNFTILYATNKSLVGSEFRARRIINNLKQHIPEIKIYSAGYSDTYLEHDMCLPSMMVDPEIISGIRAKEEKYANFLDKIKPDLIISDFDILTSLLGIEMRIPVWQVSPLLMLWANMRNLKFSERYFNKNRHLLGGQIKFILQQSTKKYIYTHFCDIRNNHRLYSTEDKNFIRPYFLLANENENTISACCEQITSRNFPVTDNFMTNNLCFLNYKDISSEDNYNQILKSKFIICDGQTDILADCFYNGKTAIIDEKADIECSYNSILSSTFGTARSLNRAIKECNFKIQIDDNARFLHERIKEYVTLGF